MSEKNSKELKTPPPSKWRSAADRLGATGLYWARAKGVEPQPVHWDGKSVRFVGSDAALPITELEGLEFNMLPDPACYTRLHVIALEAIEKYYKLKAAVEAKNEGLIDRLLRMADA